MKDKIIAGLDIGTTKICAIVGRKNEFEKLEILGMGHEASYGVIRGTVFNIDKTVQAIKKAVTKASEQSGTNIGTVNVGIAGQHIKSEIRHGAITRETDEEITTEDIKRLNDEMHRTVLPPGDEIIHVMPQDYTIDDFAEGIMDPVGMRGTKIEAKFHIITAKTDAINNIKRCIKKAELEIQDMILEPIASSLSVLSEEEIEAGVCLVDIGGGTTDVAIFHDNIIRHTSVIPFGGNVITTDIKEGCRLTEKQAELLKIKYGKAIAEEEASTNEIISIPRLRDRPPKEISTVNLSKIIQARMEEIIELVYREIITSGYRKKLTAGIVVTGGGSQLSYIQQLFEYISGLDTRIGYPNEHLGKSEVDAAKSPMYATSVGLALTDFKKLDIRETRYEEEEYEKRKKKTRQKNNLFSNFIEKTKGLLIDNFDL